MARRRGIWISAAALVVVIALVVGGITWRHSRQTTDADQGVERAAAAFVSAWQSGQLASVTWSGTTGAAMEREYAAAVAGLGSIEPTVRLGAVTRSGTRASAQVTVAWPLGPGRQWSYSSLVDLVSPTTATDQASDWQVSPDGVSGASIFAPITRDARLQLTRTPADRGRFTGKGGATIVGPGRVVDVGIEPSRATDVATLVTRVAALTGVKAGPLAKAIAAASPHAFVPVITLRESDYAKVKARLQPLPGTVFRSRTQSLALTSAFARALIGTVGPVTAEIVQASDNRYTATDFAGLSGLQRMYDAQLAGTPSYTVSEVAGSGDSSSDATLFHVAATAGQTVSTTLDPQVQKAADRALSHLTVPGALVAIDVKTGAVRAVANTPTNGLDRALVGQYQPGSTLKVATTLALLEGGLTTTTRVNCPSTITIAGRTFRNYEHEVLGQVPFSTDFKNSCNTAFVGLSRRLQTGDLHAAAAQLGLGLPWGAGLGAGPQTFSGSIPVANSAVDQAAAAFGQGRNLVSPLAMAALAASVARGRFIAPTLVTAPATTPPAAAAATAPAPRDIATLHTLMRLVVTSGTAAGQFTTVPGGPVYAKTGTAEFGTDTPPQTHAWLIGWQGNIAFAAFVDTGQSGGSVAGPVVRAFLTALH